MVLRVIILTGLLTAGLFSCQKDPKKSTASNSGNSLASNNILQANINGVTWQTPTEGFSTSKTSVFKFMGQSSPSDPYSALSFTLPVTTATGVIAFGGSGNTQASFRDTLGIIYIAKSGTINITTFDTIKYGVKKFKANFSFLSDTVGGKTYNVAGGVIDFKL